MPAWPMPIHQTKLMIGMAQPTGWLVPKMPTPVKTRCVIAISNNCTSMKEMAKPMNQPIGVLRFSTMALILSVTEPNVSSPPTTGVVM